MTEKELVDKYVRLKTKHTELKEEAAKVWHEFEEVQRALITMLDDLDATSTSKYEGLGCVTLVSQIKPKVTDKEALYSYLKEIGRGDVIKESVHHGTLASFVKEQLENGSGLPEFLEVEEYKITKLTK